MSTPRIVVTGIGASSPIGGTAPDSWSALLAGASGTHTLQHDWVEEYQLPVTFAAEALVRPDTVLERPVAKRLDPSSQLAMVAALEAWADAGSPDVEPERLGVDFATGIGGVWTLLDAWDALREKGPRRVMPMTVPMLMPNAAAGNLSLHFEARAFARTVASACASSTESIINGLEHIRAGYADVVIAGGTESAVHPITIAAFASMQALSVATTPPRRPRGPAASTATASSWARAPQSSSSRRSSTRKRAEPASTRRSWAAASPPTRTTSPRTTPRDGARRARYVRPSRWRAPPPTT